MRGELLLILVSLLAMSTKATAERSNEPIFKLTLTDKRLGAIVGQIDRFERLKRTLRQHRHSAASMIRSDGDMDYIFLLVSKIDDIYQIIGRIDDLYEYIGKFEKARYENTTQISFAEGRLADERKELTMVMFHAKFFGSEDPLLSGHNLLRFVTDSYKEYPNRTCRTPQSPQQHLYSLYVENVLTELKYLAMLEWSWLFLEKFGRTGDPGQQENVREDFERRMNRSQKMIKDQMIGVDRTVWRCDPEHPEPGVTYDEVTRLLQGYIENEVDLSAEGTCRQDCAYYQSAKSEGCHGDEFCSKQPRCGGRLHSCQFVDSDLHVCQSEKDSPRRYEFIQGEGGRHLGRAQSCSRRTDKAESWARWLFFKCSYCLCLCDEEGPQSDRYFNLRPVTADVEQNRVVTGLRFLKHNRIFHLQIQEGELLPHGVINETTLQWKPLDTYSITDKDVKRDVDFHVLSYENRSIDLVKVKADSDFVVTGLRFRVMGGHLNLEAQFTGFDFKSGQLTQATNWLSGGDDKPREKLNLENSKVPSESTLSSEPYPSENNQYVDFTNSGLDQDAAQTTVPFIDIQEVISSPPVPLSGIGVYYKGSEGYGGYLAPKLITYDYWPHVELPTV